ncbi:MAG: NUDIX domain-containing protein [Candidatus Aenigmatarchaeota archaeon]
MIKQDTAAILVEKDGRFLLIRRAVPPRQGFWELPAGHVDEGEAVAQAAQREAQEEVGEVEVEKEPFHILDPEHIRVGHQHRCHYFRGKVVGEVRAGSDAAEIGWFTLEEMKKMDISYFTLLIFNKLFPEENAPDR